ncbi:Uncharacterized protein dnm_013440 [Desulfonema magnum]|uniref:Uncharacterized protein n=1 Tax=Desulfonema magnum TaxID=45655 RepID=A0A975BGK1_9BACT|nr:Uncharacterized protein dnm_013440 [Desulfonema magnum]
MFGVIRNGYSRDKLNLKIRGTKIRETQYLFPYKEKPGRKLRPNK